EPSKSDDVGMSGGGSQDLIAVPADKQSGTACRKESMSLDAVVASLEGEVLTVEETTQDGYGFIEALDAHGGRIEDEPDLVVLRGRMTSADTQFKAAVGVVVKGCSLAGQERGVSEVVVQHQSSDMQAAG